MTAEISFYQAIEPSNKSASTSFTSEEGISAISAKNAEATNTKTLLSASSSEMLDKSGLDKSSSSFEESSDSDDKKSTTSGASSDLSSDNNQAHPASGETDKNRADMAIDQFGTAPWMETSSNAIAFTSSGNEAESPDEMAVPSSPGALSRSDSAVKSLDGTSSINNNKTLNKSSSNAQKIDTSTTPRDSVFSNSSSEKLQVVPTCSTTERDAASTDLLLYNEYTQVLRQLRRRREDDMKRARRTLEESQWLLDLLWKATNVQRRGITRDTSNKLLQSELETVQEELEQARKVFLGRQKIRSTEKKSSAAPKKVAFNRKIAVSQPAATTTKSSHQKLEHHNHRIITPSFSTTSLDSKYKAQGGGLKLKSGLSTPKAERSALIGKIIETAVKIDEKEAKLNNTPRRLANNDRLIIKLKIMLSKKWSKDGEPITWTKIEDGESYDV